MDDSLQFKVSDEKSAAEASSAQNSKEAEKNEAAAEEKSNGIEPDVKKDFRGVACPMNFVKTKIALSPMQSGQILEILLDDGQPIQNVPGSVKNEGHEVLATEKVDNYWKVTIKKK